MRILILGGDGMLGHRLMRDYAERHEVRCTLRRDEAAYADYGMFSAANSFFGVDVRRADALVEVLAAFRPEAVVNCIGIVKQRRQAQDAIISLEINALLPHRLAQLCAAVGARLIHMSTDCVFSGRDGNYREDDFADATDLYGRSKYLGEVAESNCLTLRTSIIGRELARRESLLEWFLSQAGGRIKGFTNAIYSGFTTGEMGRIIETMLCEYPAASGVYHVSSAAIDKYSLLLLLRDRLNVDVEIEPDGAFRCDRSLDSSRFRAEFAYQPPSWPEMVEELRL